MPYLFDEGKKSVSEKMPLVSEISEQLYEKPEDEVFFDSEDDIYFDALDFFSGVATVPVAPESRGVGDSLLSCSPQTHFLKYLIGRTLFSVQLRIFSRVAGMEELYTELRGLAQSQEPISARLFKLSSLLRRMDTMFPEHYRELLRHATELTSLGISLYQMIATWQKNIPVWLGRLADQMESMLSLDMVRTYIPAAERGRLTRLPQQIRKMAGILGLYKALPADASFDKWLQFLAQQSVLPEALQEWLRQYLRFSEQLEALRADIGEINERYPLPAEDDWVGRISWVRRILNDSTTALHLKSNLPAELTEVVNLTAPLVQLASGFPVGGTLPEQLSWAGERVTTPSPELRALLAQPPLNELITAFRQQLNDRVVNPVLFNALLELADPGQSLWQKSINIISVFFTRKNLRRAVSEALRAGLSTGPGGAMLLNAWDWYQSLPEGLSWQDTLVRFTTDLQDAIFSDPQILRYLLPDSILQNAEALSALIELPIGQSWQEILRWSSSQMGLCREYDWLYQRYVELSLARGVYETLKQGDTSEREILLSEMIGSLKGYLAIRPDSGISRMLDLLPYLPLLASVRKEIAVRPGNDSWFGWATNLLAVTEKHPHPALKGLRQQLETQIVNFLSDSLMGGVDALWEQLPEFNDPLRFPAADAAIRQRLGNYYGAGLWYRKNIKNPGAEAQDLQQPITDGQAKKADIPGDMTQTEFQDSDRLLEELLLIADEFNSEAVSSTDTSYASALTGFGTAAGLTAGWLATLYFYWRTWKSSASQKVVEDVEMRIISSPRPEETGDNSTGESLLSRTSVSGTSSGGKKLILPTILLSGMSLATAWSAWRAWGEDQPVTLPQVFREFLREALNEEAKVDNKIGDKKTGRMLLSFDEGRTEDVSNVFTVSYNFNNLLLKLNIFPDQYVTNLMHSFDLTLKKNNVKNKRKSTILIELLLYTLKHVSKKKGSVINHAQNGEYTYYDSEEFKSEMHFLDKLTEEIKNVFPDIDIEALLDKTTEYKSIKRYRRNVSDVITTQRKVTNIFQQTQMNPNALPPIISDELNEWILINWDKSYSYKADAGELIYEDDFNSDTYDASVQCGYRSKKTNKEYLRIDNAYWPIDYVINKGVLYITLINETQDSRIFLTRILSAIPGYSEWTYYKTPEKPKKTVSKPYMVADMLSIFVSQRIGAYKGRPPLKPLVYDAEKMIFKDQLGQIFLKVNNEYYELETDSSDQSYATLSDEIPLVLIDENQKKYWTTNPNLISAEDYANLIVQLFGWYECSDEFNKHIIRHFMINIKSQPFYNDLGSALKFVKEIINTEMGENPEGKFNAELIVAKYKVLEYEHKSTTSDSSFIFLREIESEVAKAIFGYSPSIKFYKNVYDLYDQIHSIYRLRSIDNVYEYLDIISYLKSVQKQQEDVVTLLRDTINFIDDLKKFVNNKNLYIEKLSEFVLRHTDGISILYEADESFESNQEKKEKLVMFMAYIHYYIAHDLNKGDYLTEFNYVPYHVVMYEFNDFIQAEQSFAKLLNDRSNAVFTSLFSLKKSSEFTYKEDYFKQFQEYKISDDFTEAAAISARVLAASDISAYNATRARLKINILELKFRIYEHEAFEAVGGYKLKEMIGKLGLVRISKNYYLVSTLMGFYRVVKIKNTNSEFIIKLIKLAESNNDSVNDFNSNEMEEVFRLLDIDHESYPVIKGKGRAVLSTLAEYSVKKVAQKENVLISLLDDMVNDTLLQQLTVLKDFNDDSKWMPVLQLFPYVAQVARSWNDEEYTFDKKELLLDSIVTIQLAASLGLSIREITKKLPKNIIKDLRKGIMSYKKFMQISTKYLGEISLATAAHLSSLVIPYSDILIYKFRSYLSTKSSSYDYVRFRNSPSSHSLDELASSISVDGNYELYDKGRNGIYQEIGTTSVDDVNFIKSNEKFYPVKWNQKQYSFIIDDDKLRNDGTVINVVPANDHVWNIQEPMRLRGGGGILSKTSDNIAEELKDVNVKDFISLMQKSKVRSGNIIKEANKKLKKPLNEKSMRIIQDIYGHDVNRAYLERVIDFLEKKSALVNSYIEYMDVEKDIHYKGGYNVFNHEALMNTPSDNIFLDYFYDKNTGRTTRPDDINEGRLITVYYDAMVDMFNKKTLTKKQAETQLSLNLIHEGVHATGKHKDFQYPGIIDQQLNIKPIIIFNFVHNLDTRMQNPDHFTCAMYLLAMSDKEVSSYILSSNEFFNNREGNNLLIPLSPADKIGEKINFDNSITGKLVHGDVSSLSGKGLIETDLSSNTYISSKFYFSRNDQVRKTEDMRFFDYKAENKELASSQGIIKTFRGDNIMSSPSDDYEEGYFSQWNTLGENINIIKLYGGKNGTSMIRINFDEIKNNQPTVVASGTLSGGVFIASLNYKYGYMDIYNIGGSGELGDWKTYSDGVKTLDELHQSTSASETFQFNGEYNINAISNMLHHDYDQSVIVYSSWDAESQITTNHDNVHEFNYKASSGTSSSTQTGNTDIGYSHVLISKQKDFLKVTMQAEEGSNSDKSKDSTKEFLLFKESYGLDPTLASTDKVDLQKALPSSSNSNVYTLDINGSIKNYIEDNGFIYEVVLDDGSDSLRVIKDNIPSDIFVKYDRRGFWVARERNHAINITKIDPETENKVKKKQGSNISRLLQPPHDFTGDITRKEAEINGLNLFALRHSSKIAKTMKFDPETKSYRVDDNFTVIPVGSVLPQKQFSLSLSNARKAADAMNKQGNRLLNDMHSLPKKYHATEYNYITNIHNSIMFSKSIIGKMSKDRSDNFVFALVKKGAYREVPPDEVYGFMSVNWDGSDKLEIEYLFAHPYVIASKNLNIAMQCLSSTDRVKYKIRGVGTHMGRTGLIRSIDYVESFPSKIKIAKIKAITINPVTEALLASFNRLKPANLNPFTKSWL